MKFLAIIGILCLFALTTGVFVPPRPGHVKQLGSKQCTWGPSYWCQNLTAAADCHAVPHCIQTVWMHKTLPPDNSEVCQTCLDMVKQARDQLLSNDTQELIKEVFEGSCDLLHVKPIVKECIKIADNYIPELVDTLASQMNPQVVCHVAGLCNNEKFHQLATPKQDTCEGCHTVVDLMENKLNKASKDDLLQGFLMVCGKLGSFSDACSNIIVTYFKDIYKYLQENFNSNDVCLMAGECYAQFHTHVEITPKSHIGYVPVSGDDLPCELCEQLVQHLRELLIANTTEMEFKQVLEGLCKQTNSFKQQCLDLVEEYYSVAYNFLLNELNSTVACSLIGICPSNNKEYYIAPLLLDEQMKEKPNLARVQLKKTNTNVKIISQQLPLDLLMPPHTQMLYNKETCIFCEYFLHFIQEQISDPRTEAQIQQVMDEACDKLPASIKDTCVQFVSTYEPAMVAILAQEIDPSTVCPLMKVCPQINEKDVEVFMGQGSSGECPLCLYAVTELEKEVKDKKTEANIRAALDKLCSHLSANLAAQCNDFVQTYTDELVEMLVADFNPQEVCAYLKMCTDNRITLPQIVIGSMFGGDIETNMIPDDTVNGKQIHKEQLKASPQCILCEFIMSQIEKDLKNNATDEEIEHIVRNVCRIMPKSVKQDCNKFMDENLDKIIKILIVTLDPNDVCRMMDLCDAKKFVSIQEKMHDEVLNCAVCEATLQAVENILKNPKIDQHYDHVLEKACRGLPAQYKEHCEDYIAPKYGLTLIHYANYTPDNEKDSICYKLGECSSRLFRPVV